jgi:hypothetical protein
VGIANAVPDSRMPRRFAEASRRIARTAKITLWSLMNGTAEPMLFMAEDIDTATVST